ncbi:MAG: radical SAM protein, partial [archaeon]
FRKAVWDYHPGLIGFSILEMTYDQGLELANAIKDIPVPKIFGGIYPSFAPRISLREPAVDMVCEGEGEEMLPELATALEKGEDIIKILNLTVKKDDKIYRSGEIVELEDLPTGDNIYGEKTGLRRPLTNMASTLLGPDYSIYSDKKFLRKMGGKVVRTAAVELSRGCPFSCGFCCTPMLRHQHKAGREKYSKYSGIDLEKLKSEDTHHREKPIDKFIEESKSARDNYGFNYLFITDESFLSMSEERFWEFIVKYKKEIGLPFFTETRAETVKQGYAKALEDAGCDGIAIGIESGSLRVRRELLNRFMSNDVIIDAFKEFEKTKIRISANNIIGFPYETREDIMDTVRINKQINPDNVVVNAFRPYSGTELRKLCIEKGLIPPEERAEDNRVYSAFYNGVLSSEEIGGIRKVFNLYVKFPENRWDEIRKAEKDEGLRKALNREYENKQVLQR